MRAGLHEPIRQLYDGSAAQLFSKMDVRPPTAWKQTADNFIGALKAAGILSRLDLLYVLRQPESGGSLLNWINPGVDTLTVGGGAPTFAANRGFTYNGSSDFHTSGHAMSAAGDNFSQDDACVFVVSLTDTTTAGADVGATNSIAMHINMRTAAGNFSSRCNDASSQATATADSLGFGAISRAASGEYRQIKDGAVIATKSVNSTGVATGAFCIGKANTSFSPRQISLAGMGGNLTDAQWAAFYTAWTAYVAGTP